MTPDALLTAVALAYGSAVIGVVLVYSKIAEPLRTFAARRRRRHLFDLLSCKFCCAAWSAAVLVGCYRPLLVDWWGPADLAVTWLAVAGLAGALTPSLKAALVGTVQPITTKGEKT